MQRLRYINPKGAEIVFDMTAPYIFWKIDGLSLPRVTAVKTQAAGQSGYTLHSLGLESRYIKLTGHIHGRGGAHALYEARRRLNSVCNPLLGMGTLVYENDFGAWRLRAFCSELPYLEKIRNIQTISAEFEAPSPYWLDERESAANLAYITGGAGFPLKTPNRIGTLGYLAVIDNDADAMAPIEMTIDGGSENPVVTNESTGEFIKLSRNIEIGERLYINTDPEALEVSLITVDPETNLPVRSNAYGYLTGDSSLFKLRQGENRLTFHSDDENRRVRIGIRFRKRFAGV